MKSFFRKTARILHYEGVIGLMGRLRYRPQISPALIPPPPALSPCMCLMNHGCSALHDLMARFLASHGIMSCAERLPGGCAIHIGWPRDLASVHQGDILLLSPGEDRLPVDEGALSLFSLVLDHDPARLLLWEERPAGYPHRVALPPMPSCEAASQAWFDYAERSNLAMLRFLFFCGWIKADQIDFRPLLRKAAKPIQLCLSLPETPRRRLAYLATRDDRDTVVDALLLLPGWVGAAYSYQRLARAALDLGLSELLIFQDDCQFGLEMRNHLDTIRRRMVEAGADMFAGIVTDADNSVDVRNVTVVDGLAFAELNKSVGLTFNIFGRRALERLASWDEVAGQDATIDRFLSHAPDLKVLTCVPYLARHRSDLNSTLWYFSNARYDRMIHTSERRLKARMDKWLRKHSST